jgi:predicted PurR-regulated permease PerM
MGVRWNASMRQWVALAMVVLIILGLRILWPFLAPLALSLLLTYILIPLVDRVERNTGWPRTGAAGFIYLLLLLVIVLIPATFIPVIVTQLEALVPPLVRAVNQGGLLVADIGTINILGQQIDPFLLYQQLSAEIITLGTRVAGQSVNLLFGFATTFVSTVVWMLFMLVISFYIVRDSPNIARYFWSLIPRENRLEAYYLTRRIDRTWNSFLRGQIVLSTAIFTLTTVTLLIIGLPQAVFLGFVAGILNLIPNLGPILSAVPAIVVALVQGSTQFEVSNWVFAIIVLVAYVIIQQLESQLLVPRIIGGSVRLHPAAIIIGAILGFSLMGILGIFLAAPVLASLRVLGGYAYRKLLDPDYVPEGIDLPEEIAAVPDPRERPPIPIAAPPTSAVSPRVVIAYWWERLTGRPLPPASREDSPDA